jgi:hypothetical protein
MHALFYEKATDKFIIKPLRGSAYYIDLFGGSSKEENSIRDYF